MLNLVAAVTALILIPDYFSSTPFYFQSYILLVILYSCLMYPLVYRIIYYKDSVHHFRVDNDSISMPRLLFPKNVSILKLSDVTSIEFLNLGQKGVLIIGVKNRYPVIMDKSLFKNQKDMIELEKLASQFMKRKIGEEASALREKLNAKHIELGKREFFIALLALLLFIVYVLTTNSLSENTLGDLAISIGANTRGIVSDFEIYRVFSSFVLHYNPPHLISNILIFAFVGQFIIRLLGTIRFFNIVLFSSMVAVMTSNVFIGDDASFGASGAAFGLIGAYTILKFRHHKHIPAILNPMPGWVLLLILFIEIFIGYYFEVIDLHNHLGGYIAGALYVYLTGFDKKALSGGSTVLEKTVFVVILAAYIWGISRFFALLYYS